MPDPVNVIASSRAQRLVTEALLGLVKIRNDDGNWIDGEVESATKTQAYKRLDALSCFLATKPYPKIWNYIIQETGSWLRQDIEKVLGFIKTDGFYPSPYDPVETKEGQFVDFACDVLRFCCDLADAFAGDKELMELARLCSTSAFEVLTSEGHFYQEGPDCAWAATTKFETTRGVPAYNTYFTSLLALAAHRAVNHPKVKEWWGEERCFRAKSLAQAACNYILAAARDGQVLPTADTDPVNVALFEKWIYTCWGLRALVICWDWLEAGQQTTIEDVAKGFLLALEAPLSEKAIYHNAILPNGDQGNYEHRTSIGGIITTLAELNRRAFPDLRSSLNIIAYKFYRMVVDYRDTSTNLWYGGGGVNEVASMPPLITDLLLFSETFGDLDKQLTVTMAELKSHIEAILGRSDLIENIAEIVTMGMIAVANQSEVEDIIEQMSPKGDRPPQEPKKHKKRRK